MEYVLLPKHICPKDNLIAQLEFEFAYYSITVLLVNLYATWIPRENSICINLIGLTLL